MTEQADTDSDHTPDELDEHKAQEPENEAAPAAGSPELDHLQHTIDDARDAAKVALSDQPDI